MKENDVVDAYLYGDCGAKLRLRPLLARTGKMVMSSHGIPQREVMVSRFTTAGLDILSVSYAHYIPIL